MMDETNGNGKFQREMTTASGNAMVSQEGEENGGFCWPVMTASVISRLMSVDPGRDKRSTLIILR